MLKKQVSTKLAANLALVFASFGAIDPIFKMTMCKNIKCPQCDSQDDLSKNWLITIGTDEPENLLLGFGLVLLLAGFLGITNSVLCFFLLLSALPCLCSIKALPVCEQCEITWTYQ